MENLAVRRYALLSSVSVPSIVDRCFCIFVILLPVLQQYAGIGQVISLGELVLIPFIVCYLISDRKELGSHLDRYLFWFYCVSIALSVVGGFAFPYFSMGEFVTSVSRLVFYGVLILIARKRFSWSWVKSIYLVVVTVAAVYLLAQYAYHFAFGGYLPIVLDDSLVFYPERSFENWTDRYQWYFRPSSFFLEPSYYALFTIPALALFAMDEESKSPISFGLLILTYVLSSANSGIIAAIVVTAAFVCFRKKTATDYLVISLVLLVAVVYLPFNRIEWMESAVSRLIDGGSIGNRVFRGFISYSLMDPYHQIVGVGLNNLGSYLGYCGLETGFDSDGLNYCASWLQTLNCSGVIGFLFLALFMSRLFLRCHGHVSRTLCVLLAVVMAYESILFSYRFAFLLILLEGVLRVENTQRIRCEGGEKS